MEMAGGIYEAGVPHPEGGLLQENRHFFRHVRVQSFRHVDGRSNKTMCLIQSIVSVVGLVTVLLMNLLPPLVKDSIEWRSMKDLSAKATGRFVDKGSPRKRAGNQGLQCR